MSKKTEIGSSLLRRRPPAAVAMLLAALPLLASGAWQNVVTEQGKHVEIDRASIAVGRDGIYTARGRIVLDKPIVDPKTSASYRIIEVENRYDCTDRTYATLKRNYYKDEGEPLRQEEIKNPYDMPVRSGTPDDRLLREVCRPTTPADAVAAANRTAEKVSEAAGDLRKANDALVEREVNKEARRTTARARAQPMPRGWAAGEARKPAPIGYSGLSWAYAGDGGPSAWGKLNAEFALCANGQRQSPIDVRDGIAVDLEPIQFAYRPAFFRVVDSGRNLQVAVYGGSLGLLGKNYELIRILFHRPSETRIDGKTFDMEAQLVHRAEDGKLAIVSLLLERGAENPVVQTVLNNLPLEKGGEVAPPALSLDVNRLLPERQAYFTFMGSLTTPPCTENVLWLVLKQPQQMSVEQLEIFQRLYPANARPVQPGNARIIKESR